MITRVSEINGYGEHQASHSKKKPKTYSGDFESHMDRARREINEMTHDAYKKIEGKYIYNLYSLSQYRSAVERW